MKRMVCLLIALCLCLTGTLTGCGDDGTGRGFRFPLDSEPRQLDPQVSTDRASITLAAVLFEGLTTLDEQGKPQPGAADWTVSEDGLTYTFTLKESYWSTQSVRDQDLPWETPMAVVADDFVFGLQRALSPSTGSSAGKALYAIRNAKAVHTGKKPVSQLGVKAVNPQVLTITLVQPDDRFLATLATTPCMPCNRAFFDYTAGRYGLEKAYILTNGPFQLTAWNHDESLLLGKNEHYHAASQVAPAAVRFVIAPEDPAAGLLDGTMDAALLPAADADIMAAQGVHTVTLQDTVRQLWFNTGREPLSNTSLRQALRDSIEWDIVYDYLEKAGESPATGYVPPAATLADGTVYRTDGNSQRFTTRVEQSRTALHQALAALYPEGNAQPQLTVLATNDEVSANVARYVVQSWQKHLSLSVSLQLVEETQLPALLQAGNFDVALHTVTLNGLTGGENLAMYASDAVGNYAAWQDAATDQAIATALTGGRQALESLENRLRTVCPAVPLSFPARYYGIAPGCEGITVRPFGGGNYGCPFAFTGAKKWD